MRRAWLVCAVVTIACTEQRNPLYCENDTECKIGTTCNLATHGCEALPIDAAPPDEMVIDAPFVARTIPEVRAATTPDDTPVELTDVVVVAIDRYGSRVGDVWVQQEGGGPLSGVRIFGGVTSEVAALEIGDVIDVSDARKVSYAPSDDLTGRKEVEVTPFSGGIIHLTPKMKKATPVVTMVDAAAIAQLLPAQADAERDKLVGMLVRVVDVAATADASIYEFPISSFIVDAQLAPFPGAIMQSHCFESITGVVTYFRDYRLLPRTTAELDDMGCL